MDTVDLVVQGFPGKAVCQGGLGWSAVSLLRDEGRTMLVDVRAFGVRRELSKQLQEHGVKPGDLTDIVLTQVHYDHAVNFALFPNATVWTGGDELSWAARQPPGFHPLPKLYVKELTTSGRVQRIRPGDRSCLDWKCAA